MGIGFLPCRMSQLWTSDRTGADCEFYYGEGRPLSGEVTAGEVASVAPFGGEVHALQVDDERLRALSRRPSAPTGRTDWSGTATAAG